MNEIYRDGLIEITDDEIVFHRYYFPFGSDKRVPLSQIESVEVLEPSIWSGSWRLWGSAGRTWFPLDGARPSRDKIFVAHLRGRIIRVGFTVEHSEPVMAFLRERGLLVANAS